MIVEAQEGAQQEGVLRLISDVIHRHWEGRGEACIMRIFNYGNRRTEDMTRCIKLIQSELCQ
jgi:hypothetical protein